MGMDCSFITVAGQIGGFFFGGGGGGTSPSET